jgi:hypothetical protein
MTKEECAALVEQIYATYNSDILDVDRPRIMRAWFDLIHDLSYSETKAAFIQIATFSDFMPRPGAVRRKTIDNVLGQKSFPDPYIAWTIFQSILKAAINGIPYEGERPDAVMKTMDLLGDSVGDFHTNGDREAFVSIYKSVVMELDNNRYAIKIHQPENTNENTPTKKGTQ